MPELNWQKSTFSGGPEGECLNIATAPDGTLRLRESDTPDETLHTAQRSVAALLRHIKRTGPLSSAWAP